VLNLNRFITENQISRVILDAAIEVHRERLTGLKLGLVINFGERILKAGIHRVVNGLPEDIKF